MTMRRITPPRKRSTISSLKHIIKILHLHNGHMEVTIASLEHGQSLLKCHSAIIVILPVPRPPNHVSRKNWFNDGRMRLESDFQSVELEPSGLSIATRNSSFVRRNRIFGTVEVSFPLGLGVQVLQFFR